MDGMVTIWKDKKPIRGHKLTSSLTNFHCEEMLVCGTYDGTVFWFSDTEHHTHLKMDASPVTCLLQDVSGHKSGVICDYETKNVFRAHEGQVNYLEKQEIIYSAGADAIRAFDLRLPKEKGRRVLNLEQKSVCAHRRDHQWYSLCDGTLSVMDTRTKHKQEISLHKGHPYSHCFTPTQGIAGWTDGTVSVFDLTTLDFYNVKQTDNAIRSLLVDDKIRGVGDDGLFISLCNPFH
ncbi:hypothetical protein EDD86DRAFT_214854 [Gorgonomyces haynaldii]|nr:hypothetical protein EDD86DRAFT_214854 [Gorgonomyces haynaldii]